MDELTVDGPDRNGVAVLTLNRPRRKNALTIALRDSVTGALAELAAGDRVATVIVTGAGPDFCAGFDLTEFDSADQEQLWLSSDRFHEAVLRFPLPMIAAVNGAARGAGADLAAMCDLRIADTSATFGHPEIAFTSVVYRPLHDLIGGARARELTLTRRVIGADEALRIGLVNDIAEPAALMDATVAMARVISGAPHDVLRAMKAKFIERAQIPTAPTLAL